MNHDEPADVTMTLETPDGQTADITDAMNRVMRGEDIMATATKGINDEAVEHITAVIHERVNEMIPDLLTYVAASEEAGSLTLKVVLEPVKKTPGAYWINVIPALSVKGMRSDRAASIERVGSHLQLKLGGVG